jgi:hypothetical protein
MSKCLFDVLFGDELELDDLRAFRMELGEKIYYQNTTTGDDLKWRYVRDCIKSDYTTYPIAIQCLVVLCACWLHECIRKTIKSQYDDLDFLKQYLELVDYTLNDFCQSDPVYSESLWKIAFETLQYAWKNKDVSRPWNTLSVRDTGPSEAKRALKRKTE